LSYTDLTRFVELVVDASGPTVGEEAPDPYNQRFSRKILEMATRWNVLAKKWLY
jgi:hypothetical protein